MIGKRKAIIMYKNVQTIMILLLLLCCTSCGEEFIDNTENTSVASATITSTEESIIDTTKAPEIPKVTAGETSLPTTTEKPTSTPKPTQSINVNVGDYIKFGEYEQDNNMRNGKEAIEWLVLETRGNSALVISKYILDNKKYNEMSRAVYWYECAIRKWLNNDFINSAFSSSEQAKIEKVTVDNRNNTYYGVGGGKDTQDQVFLLSCREARKYFSSEEARKCAPTSYAIEKGVTTSKYHQTKGDPTCMWILRAPIYAQGYVASVDAEGYVFGNGDYNYFESAVRPAMWITLEG